MPSPTAQLDTLAHAALARATASLSPAAGLLAWQDWSAHLVASPGKQLELVQQAAAQAVSLAHYFRDRLLAGPGEARMLVEPPAHDRRFTAPEWRRWPFNLWHQSFLLTQQWWGAATRAR